jgi:hypothetical protein
MKAKLVALDVQQKVEAYVYQKYRTLEKKNLIIKETDHCFFVYDHKDGSPLILSKDII